MAKKNKMSKQEAHNILYAMWENGEVPSNFTEDHSEYSTAIRHLMENGEVDWEDIAL